MASSGSLSAISRRSLGDLSAILSVGSSSGVYPYQLLAIDRDQLVSMPGRVGEAEVLLLRAKRLLIADRSQGKFPLGYQSIGTGRPSCHCPTSQYRRQGLI